MADWREAHEDGGVKMQRYIGKFACGCSAKCGTTIRISEDTYNGRQWVEVCFDTQNIDTGDVETEVIATFGLPEGYLLVKEEVRG